jgi:hypothetical protein
LQLKFIRAPDQEAVHVQHNAQSGEVEGGEEGPVGVVDFSVEPFPDPEAVDLSLFVVFEGDVPSLVHDAPL